MYIFNCIFFTGLQNPKLSFSSQAQYLLLNEESISWLCNRIVNAEDFNKDTVLHRFRGNIVLSGCKAFEELSWKLIRIGKTEFQVVHLYNLVIFYKFSNNFRIHPVNIIMYIR